MKFAIEIITFLFLVILYQSKAQDVSTMPPDALEDLYDILNNIPLINRGTPSQNVTSTNIKYVLIIKGKNNGTQITSKNIDIIDKNNPLIILIHGWQQDVNTSWYKLMIREYFKKSSNLSILLVDYSKYSKQNYVFAAYDSYFVGQFVGEFIVELIRNLFPLKKILVIGHSLGGQVASFSGKSVEKILGSKLETIVALDPAGPLFATNSEEKRLAPSDAHRVLPIHTNGGVLGMLKSCGSIDFFPNGGSLQTGCVRQVIRNISEITNSVFCNHRASWQYFAKTINHPEVYLGINCSSWLGFPLFCSGSEYMGNLRSNKTGSYFLSIPIIPYKEY